MDKREALLREHERLSQGRGQGQFWRPKVGPDNAIRILPHWSGDVTKVFYRRIFRHFGVGPDKTNIVCRKTLGESEVCPVCDFVAELKATGRKEDIPLASDLRAKERFVCNVIDVNEASKGVQIWELGSRLFDDLLSLFLDDEYKDIDTLDRGRHIKITRVGEGKNDTRYSLRPAANVSVVDPRVMQKAYDLEKFYKVPSEEDAVAALRGDEFAEADAESDDIPFSQPESEPSFRGAVDSGEDAVLSIPLDDEPAAKPAPQAPQPSSVSRATKLREMRERVK